MSTLFISDLHLSAERPDITALFKTFLQQQARHSDALYILGDLFDAWIGDDDLNPFHCDIIAALKALTAQGTPVYFIAGNRDFLIGKRFAHMTGITLLEEAHVIELYGTPTLLMHGDTLCTLDTGYLKFRKIIRNPCLLAILTRLPLRLRRAIATTLRSGSKSQQPLTEEQLARMDATDQGVIEAVRKHPVKRIIHGHTHRPNVHHHKLDGVGTVERIVLGDWYEQGSVLEVSANHFDLRSQPLADAE